MNNLLLGRVYDAIDAIDDSCDTYDNELNRRLRNSVRSLRKVLPADLPDVLIALHEAMRAHPDEQVGALLFSARSPGDSIHDYTDPELAEALRAYAKPPSAKDRLRAAFKVHDDADDWNYQMREDIIKAARAIVDEIGD